MCSVCSLEEIDKPPLQLYLFFLTFAYLIVSAVVLVNMLIAMVNSTYGNFNEEGQLTYNFFNFNFLKVEFDEQTHIVPPPFNTLVSIIDQVLYFLRVAENAPYSCPHCHCNLSRLQRPLHANEAQTVSRGVYYESAAVVIPDDAHVSLVAVCFFVVVVLVDVCRISCWGLVFFCVCGE